MSNYRAPTRHPITGAIEMADWLDDSFGRHIYGVRFHGEEKIYPGKDCAEISPDKMLEEIERLSAEHCAYAVCGEHGDMVCTEIERLQAALRGIAAASKIIAKGEDMETALKVMLASYQNIARKALEGEKTDD